MAEKRENGGVFRWTGAALRVIVVGVLLAVVAVACAGSPASADPVAPCGASTLATLTAVDTKIANNIDGGELAGSETQVDLRHVTGAADLLSAVAAGNRAATQKAVSRIVYHHFWHIVRLRALDTSGRVLADVGGPYVIAPVRGVLSVGGRVIGSFVMSVQDDMGFAKLERHAIGDPIGIYVNGKLAVELGGYFPVHQPLGPQLSLAGISYAALPLTYNAFPAGELSAVIAVPLPSAALTAESCPAIVVGEIGRVAERIAARFNPLVASYAGFVETCHADTGALVVVRIGLRTIGGSNGPGPPVLPQSGTVSYLSKNWSVFSFAPTPPARIYLLIAAGAPAPNVVP
jgi:hypothetical protein